MKLAKFFISLFLLFALQPLFAFPIEWPNSPKAALTPDQRVDQVLQRLTFGPRPGDLETVKKIGVKAYIEQQLDPDAIEDSSLNKRLEKLPTLMLSNPTLAEVYNPPKPKPTPTPETKPPDIIAAEPRETPSPTPTPKPTPTPIARIAFAVETLSSP